MASTPLKYVRKQLYVTDQTPALAIEDDLYVKAGLTKDMDDNDLLVLGLVLSLKNHEWRDKIIARAREKMIGATTPTSRISRAMEMLSGAKS